MSQSSSSSLEWSSEFLEMNNDDSVDPSPDGSLIDCPGRQGCNGGRADFCGDMVFMSVGLDMEYMDMGGVYGGGIWV